MKYTIQEITKAWFRFTQPKYLVDSKKIDSTDLKPFGIIPYENSVTKLEIDYSTWIPYLISEEWKNENN